MACVSIGSIIINFDAIDYIFTRKGSFLCFKDRNTANQKLIEKIIVVKTLNKHGSVSGVAVIIVAFQAADPGSTPG